MLGKTLIENWVPPGLGWSVFQCAGHIGPEVCSFVKTAFGSLRDEAWRGRGGVFENLGKRKLVSRG